MRLPGKPAAHNHGLLCLNKGLLYGILACCFGLPGLAFQVLLKFRHFRVFDVFANAAFWQLPGVKGAADVVAYIPPTIRLTCKRLTSTVVA